MTTKTLWVPKKIWLAAAVCWTVFVTVLCLVSFGDLPSVNVSGVDKYVHATFHFVFVLLWYQYLHNGAKNVRVTLVSVFAMSVGFGIVLEFLQGFFTATRQADAKDVAANCVGALIAIALLYAYKKARMTAQ